MVEIDSANRTMALGAKQLKKTTTVVARNLLAILVQLKKLMMCLTFRNL